MWRRALLICALSLAAPLVGLPCWIALQRGDLADPGDADLQVHRPSIPPDQDGFALLRTAAARSTARTLDDASSAGLIAALKREALDSELIDKLAHQNSTAFDALEQALAAPQWMVPVFQVEDDDVGEMRMLMDVQHLVRIAAARAQSLATRGKTRPALEDALLGMRFGRKICEATGAHLLAMIIGTSSQSISLGAIEGLLRNDLELSPSESRRLALELDSYRCDDTGWRSAWATEYQFAKALYGREVPEPDLELQETWQEIEEDESFSDWVIGLLPEDYLLQPNRTLGLLADEYRELSRRSTQTCAEWHDLEDPMDDSVFDDPSEWETLRDLLRPNYWGRMVSGMTQHSNLRFLTKRCHVDTRISLVQALAGLDAYSHAMGRLPNSLEGLVPTYLATVPTDRFDGHPLRYSSHQKTVYSIGDDFTDDGPPDEASQGCPEAPAIRL